MALTNNQAIKIATMMLQAATYVAPFMTLHPIVTRKDGREETYQAIAKALSMLTGINESYITDQLIESNGNSDMLFDELPESIVTRLQSDYQNAPVYQDGKGRQYIMFNGVRTQDYCYQVIDVARYVDFAQTGKYRNIDTLRKRIQRNSDATEIYRLEDSGEIENIEPTTIQHLYH
jgi:hypothetical protein